MDVEQLKWQTDWTRSGAFCAAAGAGCASKSMEAMEQDVYRESDCVCVKSRKHVPVECRSRL